MAKEIDFQKFVDLFPSMEKQTYTLSGAQTPSQIPGARMHASRIGMDTTNCVKFTFWMVAKAFDLTFTSDSLKAWMVTKDMVEVPGYGPWAAKELGVATDSPGEGMYLVQFFRNMRTKNGHSLFVVDHCKETDKILTLEAVGGKIDGAGWYEIGALRDVKNPGRDWRDKVTETWQSRLGKWPACHYVRLNVDPESIKAFLGGYCLDK